MLKFILTLILIVYGLRALARLFMPFMVKSVVKKAQENFNQQQRTQSREGEIHVDYMPPNPKKKSHLQDKGDFVDYEEIK
ncbi:MAG: hypothetical protein RI934_400 [Bacteroidota bacterium]|jgi:hypothetical protein